MYGHFNSCAISYSQNLLCFKNILDFFTNSDQALLVCLQGVSKQEPMKNNYCYNLNARSTRLLCRRYCVGL